MRNGTCHGTALLCADIDFVEFVNCAVWLLSAAAAYWMRASEMTFVLHKLNSMKFVSALNSIKFLSFFSLFFALPCPLFTFFTFC